MGDDYCDYNVVDARAHSKMVKLMVPDSGFKRAIADLMSPYFVYHWAMPFIIVAECLSFILLATSRPWYCTVMACIVLLGAYPFNTFFSYLVLLRYRHLRRKAYGTKK